MFNDESLRAIERTARINSIMNKFYYFTLGAGVAIAIAAYVVF